MTAAPGDLEGQTAEFAEQMDALLRAVVSDDVSIRHCRFDLEDGSSRYLVANGVPAEAPASALREMRGDPIAVPGVDGLHVQAWWRFVANSAGLWIKVEWSQFALSFRNANKGLTPLIRVEVDSTKGAWARAHINLTAESSLLGHLYGLQGRRYRRVQNLHIPVGGYAYRPCLEDFLEFAVEDQLLPERPGWREALDWYRPEYHRKQLMSLVTKNPEAAIEALRSEGFLDAENPPA